MYRVPVLTFLLEDKLSTYPSACLFSFARLLHVLPPHALVFNLFFYNGADHGGLGYNFLLIHANLILQRSSVCCQLTAEHVAVVRLATPSTDKL